MSVSPQLTRTQSSLIPPNNTNGHSAIFRNCALSYNVLKKDTDNMTAVTDRACVQYLTDNHAMRI